MTDTDRWDLDEFREYRKTGDRRLRNRLIERHIPLARARSGRFTGRGEARADLDQVAFVGLLKAVERFDPSLGIAFSTFAIPTIDGELKRHFRGQWDVHVPRGLQESSAAAQRALAELTQKLGRSPSVEEVADHTHMSVEAVLEGLEVARAYRVRSLDAGAPDDSEHSGPGRHPVVETLGAEDPGMDRVDASATIETLLEILPERERNIIRLRYFGRLTQSEIAERLGISQMHVSRLLARSLEVLRGQPGLVSE